MRYGLIGEHLPHSFSKEVHAVIGAYPYKLIELTPEQVPVFLREGDFDGINVTIPYKQTVMPLLDRIDERALAVGAVNTVVRRGGHLCGYNTDFIGMTDCLSHYGISLTDRRVLILGSGGTAHTARAVATAQGAREVLTVSRRGGDGCLTYEQAYARGEEIDVILNTTPVGMYPHPDAAPVALERFPALTGVMDAIYNPLRSQLVLAARARGIPAAGGLYMLVSQATAASALFFDRPLPTEAQTADVFRRILMSKENIVLIGMPGAGKSAVGQHLSRITGRPFYDSDAEIVLQAGRPIRRIFAEEGEGGFREREQAILSQLSQVADGRIIATGGGAVLREANVNALRRNGRLYFIDRPLDDIMPTEDRPLSSDRQMLAQRYAEREPLYRRAADAVLPVQGDAASVARALLAEWEGRDV